MKGKKEKRPEKQTWAEPAATAVISVRALSVTSLRVENLREGRCKKKKRWKKTGINTDLNKPKKETGLRSSPAGLATFTSMVVGSPVELIEAESCFSDCFGLSQERGLLGEGEGLSFSSDDMLGMEEGRSDKKASNSRPTAKYFYPSARASGPRV